MGGSYNLHLLIIVLHGCSHPCFLIRVFSSVFSHPCFLIRVFSSVLFIGCNLFAYAGHTHAPLYLIDYNSLRKILPQIRLLRPSNILKWDTNWQKMLKQESKRLHRQLRVVHEITSGNSPAFLTARSGVGEIEEVKQCVKSKTCYDYTLSLHKFSSSGPFRAVFSGTRADFSNRSIAIPM